jgi:hypothetical protein
MWLFFVTVILAAISWGISYNYRSHASKLTGQLEELNRSKMEYDKRLAEMVPAATLRPAGDIVKIPRLGLKCGNLLACAPITHYEELALPHVVQAPTEALKRELDEKRKQVTARTTEVTATSQKVDALEQVDRLVRRVMAPLISLIVLGASLFVILSGGYKAEGERWAFGSIGTIIGFWLKG